MQDAWQQNYSVSFLTHSSRKFTWFRRRGFKRGGEHNVLWKQLNNILSDKMSLFSPFRKSYFFLTAHFLTDFF